MKIDNEMFSDLAHAVFADDLPKARETLELMLAVGNYKVADCILRARRASHPLPAPASLRAPFTLPVPGHLPGSTLGDPKTANAA
jgi:hypothetical protein